MQFMTLESRCLDIGPAVEYFVALLADIATDFPKLSFRKLKMASYG
jgi:hypothetical protein